MNVHGTPFPVKNPDSPYLAERTWERQRFALYWVWLFDSFLGAVTKCLIQHQQLKGRKVSFRSWFQKCHSIMLARVWWNRAIQAIATGRIEQGRKQGSRSNTALHPPQSKKNGLLFLTATYLLIFLKFPKMSPSVGDRALDNETTGDISFQT